MIQFSEEVIYALVKYSINRASAYNSFACEEIIRVSNELSQKCLGNVIKDIYEALVSEREPIPYSREGDWVKCLHLLYEKANIDTRKWLYSSTGGNIPSDTKLLPI